MLVFHYPVVPGGPTPWLHTGQGVEPLVVGTAAGTVLSLLDAVDVHRIATHAK